MRATRYALLVLVAAAAMVMSFTSLHGLAELCGFGWTSPLLPLVVDVGAGAGTLVWLTSTPGRARTYGRALALALLGLSVAGNALAHGLVAADLRPHWLVVVAVSAVAPAVLGAVVHLTVLAGQPDQRTKSAPKPATKSETRQVRPAAGSGPQKRTSADRTRTNHAELVRQVSAWEPDQLSRKRIQQTFKVGVGRASRVLDEVRSAA